MSDSGSRALTRATPVPEEPVPEWYAPGLVPSQLKTLIGTVGICHNYIDLRPECHPLTELDTVPGARSNQRVYDLSREFQIAAAVVLGKVCAIDDAYGPNIRPNASGFPRCVNFDVERDAFNELAGPRVAEAIEDWQHAALDELWDGLVEHINQVDVLMHDAWHDQIAPRGNINERWWVPEVRLLTRLARSNTAQIALLVAELGPEGMAEFDYPRQLWEARFMGALNFTARFHRDEHTSHAERTRRLREDVC